LFRLNIKNINMKKAIIGLSSVIILAFAIILFVNAQSGPQEVKKAATEVSKDCAKCPSAATCTKVSGPNATATASATSTSTSTATCDPAKCKAAGCDMTKCKEGKCDPATCKVNCASKGDMKACDPAKCPMKAVVK
jgi:hypothetical protein